MRRLLTVLALFLAPLAFAASACASPSVGNGSYGQNQGNGVGCYQEVFNNHGIAIGNSSGMPYLQLYLNGSPTVVSNYDPSESGTVGGGFTSSVGPVDPCTTTQSLATYAHVAATNQPYFPWLSLFALGTGAVTTAQIGSDNVATAGQGHDLPAIVFDLPGSCAGIGYGAISTYVSVAGGPPSATWQTTGWGASSGYAEPFKKGCNLNSTTDPLSWSNSANEYFLPTSGISEVSNAQAYGGVGGKGISCGQTQPTTNYMFPGVPGCISYTITSPTDVSFDVLCNGAIVQKIDTFATTGAAWNNCDGLNHVGTGLMQLFRSPASSDYYHFSVTAVPTSNANVTVNCPTSGTASIAVLTTDTTAGVASKIASGMTAQCSTNFLYIEGATSICSTACVGVEFTPSAGSWSAQSTPVANGCSGAGVTCGNNVSDYLTSGHAHFLYGGVTYVPEMFGWVFLYDIEPDTSNYRQAAGSGIGEALALFWSPGPTNGVWPLCDIAGNNCSNVSPGQTFNQLLGMSAGGSCAAGSDCTEPDVTAIGTNGYCVSKCTTQAGRSPYLLAPPSSWATNAIPFCYDWGSQGQQNCIFNAGVANYPVLSQETVAYWQGNLYVAYPNYNGTTHTDGIEILKINPATKAITSNWFMTASAGTSPPLINMTLQFGQAQDGSHLALFVASGDSAKTVNGTASSGLIFNKTQTTDGATWSAFAAVVGPTATGNALAAPCQMTADVLKAIVSANCFTASPVYPSPNAVNFYQLVP